MSKTEVTPEPSFEKSIAELFLHEGSRVCENDKGRGVTKYGLSVKSYREAGITKINGEKITDQFIRDLTPSEAAGFYYHHRWLKYNLHKMPCGRLSTTMLVCLTSFLLSAWYLQRVINEHRPTDALKVDGIIGPKTIRAVHADNCDRVVRGIKAKVTRYYEELYRKNPERYHDVIDGWRARIQSQ